MLRSLRAILKGIARLVCMPDDITKVISIGFCR